MAKMNAYIICIDEHIPRHQNPNTMDQQNHVNHIESKTK